MQQEAICKQKYGKSNPRLVYAYLNARLHALFKYLFKVKVLEIYLLWFRIEYQRRGSPRLHGCLCLKHNPGLMKHATAVFNGSNTARKLKILNELTTEEYFEGFGVRFEYFIDINNQI